MSPRYNRTAVSRAYQETASLISTHTVLYKLTLELCRRQSLSAHYRFSLSYYIRLQMHVAAVKRIIHSMQRCHLLPIRPDTVMCPLFMTHPNPIHHSVNPTQPICEQILVTQYCQHSQ